MQRYAGSLIAVIWGAWAMHGPALAGDLFSTSNGSALFKQQTSYLDGKAASQYSYSVNLQPNAIAVPGNGSAAYDGRYRGEYLNMAKAAARRHGIPQDLFLRLVQQESGWNPRAKSHAGAMGLAQIMPATARLMGVKDPWDPRQNLEGGAKYLRQMYVKFKSWRLALAAYNAGPQAVARHDGIPPFKETQGYVKAIMGS